MASDLTERLAAKLGRGECVTIDGERMVYLVRAKYLLPLLLSEPELVASLSEEVRVKALESLLNSAPVMESAFVDAAEVLALAPEELRLSVLTPRERAVMKLGEASWAMQVAADAYVLSDADESGPEWDAVVDSQGPLNAATADVAALTPEGKDG